MKSPFVDWDEDRKVNTINSWVKNGLINKASGWDLVQIDDEWGIYPLEKIKKLAKYAGIEIRAVNIDLEMLLSSEIVIATFESKWIESIQNVEEVYVDVILDYLEEVGANIEAHIEII